MIHCLSYALFAWLLVSGTQAKKPNPSKILGKERSIWFNARTHEGSLPDGAACSQFFQDNLDRDLRIFKGRLEFKGVVFENLTPNTTLRFCSADLTGQETALIDITKWTVTTFIVEEGLQLTKYRGHNHLKTPEPSTAEPSTKAPSTEAPSIVVTVAPTTEAPAPESPEPNHIVLSWDSCPPENSEGFANQTIDVLPNTAADYELVSKNFNKGNAYPSANNTVTPNFYQCILYLRFVDMTTRPDVTVQQNRFNIKGGKKCATEFLQLENIVKGQSEDPDDRRNHKKTFNRYCGELSGDKDILLGSNLLKVVFRVNADKARGSGFKINIAYPNE